MKYNTNDLPYFLRFDIRLYYPSITHTLLIKEVEVMFGKKTNKKNEEIS